MQRGDSARRLASPAFGEKHAWTASRAGAHSSANRAPWLLAAEAAVAPILADRPRRALEQALQRYDLVEGELAYATNATAPTESLPRSL